MDLMGLLSMLGLGGEGGGFSGLTGKLTGLFGSSNGLEGLNFTGAGELPQGVGGGVFSPGAGNPWGGRVDTSTPWYTNPRNLMLMSSMMGMGQRQQQQPLQPPPMPMSPNSPPNLGGLMSSRGRRLSLEHMEPIGGY